MGASHAIGHVLGRTCDMISARQGSCPAPWATTSRRRARAQKSIAGALRAPDLDASDAFAGFIGVFGLPSRLSALGVGEDKLSLLGEKAMFSIFA